MSPEKQKDYEKPNLSKRRRLDFKADRLGKRADMLEAKGKASKEKIQKIRDKEAETRKLEQEENVKLTYERTNFAPFKRQLEKMGVKDEVLPGGILRLEFPDSLQVVVIEGEERELFLGGEIIFTAGTEEHITGFSSSDLEKKIRLGITSKYSDYTVYEITQK